MKFENMFGSADRDPRQDKKFVPIEQIADSSPNPEARLILDEATEDEPLDSEEANEGPDPHEDSELPPENGTEYDRLIALAQTKENLLNHAGQSAGTIDNDDINSAVMRMTQIKDDKDRTEFDSSNGFWLGFLNGRRGREHRDKHQKGGDTTRHNQDHLS